MILISTHRREPESAENHIPPSFLGVFRDLRGDFVDLFHFMLQASLSMFQLLLHDGIGLKFERFFGPF